ncbi:NF-kappa-B inhibitor cactus isoform X2 [Dermacentor silvarum]|uniref:NF-kappa-B inhibitor cactus isoform X2 n=1 Tax=Dermacentor silvarum TaxID=543639 RepID=UPI002101648A|nr:NF-kappa-B inhibitor cactus isoform X2 [Dermacentor silvarum]
MAACASIGGPDWLEREKPSTMSRRTSAGPRKAGASEGRTDLTPSSPPVSPLKKDERKSLTDSGYDAGYTSMSCSTATDPDIISKSTCSMLDSGVLDEEAHHSGDIKGAASASATKLDSGYIEPSSSAFLLEEDCETQLLGRKLGVREMYAQDDDGDTLLHVSVIKGWTRLLVRIIRETPHPDLLDIQNDYGQTALHVAALCSRHHEARLLVVAGATVDLTDDAGRTPLHLACQRGDCRVSSDLLADVTEPRYDVRPGQRDSARTAALVSQRTLTGDTALHLAVRSGSLDLIELLLHHVPDPNVRERYCGATPLHLACRLGRPDLADALLRSGRVDVNATDYGRKTALRHLWDAQRQNPRSKDLLRLVLLLRDHGGTPIVDPGSEDEDDSEDSSEDYNDSEDEEDDVQAVANAINNRLSHGNPRVNDIGTS